MRDARAQAEAICTSNRWEGGLTNIALGYGMRRGSGRDDTLGMNVPTAVGLSRVEEVHEAVRVWREVHGAEKGSEARKRLEEDVVRCFVEAGWSGWSWASPTMTGASRL